MSASSVPSLAVALTAVAAGGALGACLRYLSVVAATALFGLKFPVGTLFVNVAGSLVMGLVAGFIRDGAALSPTAQLFLMTGLLGGFTTFSAFSLDAIRLIDAGENEFALLYVAASVGLSVIALMVGLGIAGLLGRS